MKRAGLMPREILPGRRQLSPHAQQVRATGSGDNTPPVLVEDGSRFTWQREDLSVVLVEPKIPQNSGNVSRSCAATRTPLHLVAPAFALDDTKLKRAGLDYWDWVCLKPHGSVESFLEWYAQLPGEKRLIAFSKLGKTHHATEGLYRRESEGRPVRNFLMFGAEDTVRGRRDRLMSLARTLTRGLVCAPYWQGLPDIAHAAATDIVRIPMAVDHVRSLNLATSVGVGVFEVRMVCRQPLL
jgi:tRNA (cytidine/uridine-2'-O-)-methyltransferase